MSNLRTIATRTALALLLSYNCILPTEAFTDDEAYSYDYETTSNLNVTCASTDPSVFTFLLCYTVVSNIDTTTYCGTVNSKLEDYRYEFYGQELEGGPVDASVDERIGQAVTIYLYSNAAGTRICWINIGNDESCDCTPCDTDVDGKTTFRIDCSLIDGGIDASDTCVELAPYPPIYDPHLGKDSDDFYIITTDDNTAYPIDDDYVPPLIDDDYVPQSKIGSLFRRFGG